MNKKSEPEVEQLKDSKKSDEVLSAYELEAKSWAVSDRRMMEISRKKGRVVKVV